MKVSENTYFLPSLTIQITNRLGHCLSYDKTLEIETAQALKAQVLANNSSALPVKPTSLSDTVLTYFWVDNFDMNVETQAGGGAINITHLVAFQEASERSSVLKDEVNFPRTKKRKIDLQNEPTKALLIDAKKEPPLIQTIQNVTSHFDTTAFSPSYFIWLFLR